MQRAKCFTWALLIKGHGLFSFSGNVAHNKPTMQAGLAEGHTSWRAVDGNIDTNQDHGSCAHPDDDSRNPAWWRVDLGKLHRIYNVTIYNTNGDWLSGGDGKLVLVGFTIKGLRIYM